MAAWGYLLVGVSVLAQIEAFVISSGRAPPAHHVLRAPGYHDLGQRMTGRAAEVRMAARESDEVGDGTDIKPTSEDPSLGVKAAWYGSELFGNIIGLGKKKEPEEASSSKAEPISRADAVARLKTDFDRFYFVTGQMDLDLYEPECVFADPFVAFEGRDRFKNNLDNLGSLMQDVSLDVTSWEEAEASIKTKWRFRCVLGLPWKPTLAAAGGTEFFFNQESGRIERHVESWEIEPIDALKQLIRPGRKKSSGS
ncbi:unnamed protein product [Ectocarpus sp. 6 AP-2014]